MDNQEAIKNHIKAVEEHKIEVGTNLMFIISKIVERLSNHDASKLESPEAEEFAKATPKLQSLVYGSDEYKETLKELEVAIKHHYMSNRHHPEHFDYGINDMTLIDLIEMFCDWKASTKRHATGNMEKSIKINQDRFNVSPQLNQIFINTVKEFNW